MKSEEVIRETLKKLEDDSILKEETATIEENAPLALMQLEMETRIRVLKWVLGE